MPPVAHPKGRAAHWPAVPALSARLHALCCRGELDIERRDLRLVSSLLSQSCCVGQGKQGSGTAAADALGNTLPLLPPRACKLQTERECTSLLPTDRECTSPAYHPPLHTD